MNNKQARLDLFCKVGDRLKRQARAMTATMPALTPAQAKALVSRSVSEDEVDGVIDRAMKTLNRVK
tara:strand:+ start:622 stop:819 length:198 start_codon:yes stop_codon:yes gene_type:complete